MSGRVILSVGCDTYDHIDPLFGAERDGRRFYELLCDPRYGDYEATRSSSLFSPTLSEFRSQLQQVIFGAEEIDVLTIFFAGHGAMAAGTFYLCLRDTKIGQFSATGFRFLELFSMISEAKPQQTNIILDACHAGGMAFDMHGLLRPEALGQAGTPGITLFGAAAIDEYAVEMTTGGVATSALISVMRGERTVQEARPWLDLVEVGQAVSELISSHGTQNPVVWGLNLFGAGRFVHNPCYRAEGDLPYIPLLAISTNSPEGKLIKFKSERIWEEYRRLPDEFDPRRLHDLLESITKSLSHDKEQLISFVAGVAQTMSPRAARSSDPMVDAQVLSCCALLLLPHAALQPVAAAMRMLITQAALACEDTLEKLGSDLHDAPMLLLSDGNPFAQFFYLPLRLSRIFGWIGAVILIRRLLLPGAPHQSARMEALIALLMERYGGSVLAMSDTQAPEALIFCRACEVLNWEDFRDEFLGRMWENFLEIHGKVADARITPDDAFEYSLARASKTLNEVDANLIANPGILGGVLLACAQRASIADNIDPFLHQADHHRFNIFIPESYYDFAQKKILNGLNNTFEIGQGIWEIQEFSQQYNQTCEPAIQSADGSDQPGVIAGTIIASLLFPDRVPFIIGSSHFLA